MGFFDSLTKIASEVKKVADVISDQSSKPAQNTSADTSGSGSSVSVAVREISLEKSSTNNSRPCENEVFFCDADGNDVIYIQKSLINRAFHQFDSGAGEIDFSYIYSPDVTDDDGYGDYKSGSPSIYVGFCSDDYEAIRKYENSHTIANGFLIFKLSDSSMFKYKTITTFEKWGLKRICYHYYRGGDTDLMYQVVLEYSTKYAGSDVEKLCFEAFNEFASNYSETLK